MTSILSFEATVTKVYGLLRILYSLYDSSVEPYTFHIFTLGLYTLADRILTAQRPYTLLSSRTVYFTWDSFSGKYCNICLRFDRIDPEFRP